MHTVLPTIYINANLTLRNTSTGPLAGVLGADRRPRGRASLAQRPSEARVRAVGRRRNCDRGVDRGACHDSRGGRRLPDCEEELVVGLRVVLLFFWRSEIEVDLAGAQSGVGYVAHVN